MRAYIDVHSAKIYGFDKDGDSQIDIRLANGGGTVALKSWAKAA
jgi:hypothetical protein